MDTRHIGYIRTSLDFRLPCGNYGTSLPTLAGFVRSVYYVANARRSLNGNLSGRYSLIRFLGISVLLQPLGRNGITFYRDPTHRTIAIGKRLILSPAFPPPHTVHATFTAHGVPSTLPMVTFMVLTALYPSSLCPAVLLYGRRMYQP
jgi:hypothetical protein